MAQRNQLTWTELRVGLFVLAGAALLVVVIFYVTGGSGLGPKYRLYTYLREVDGLSTGAPVRLDGLDIGNVESLAVAVPKPGEPVNPERRIRVDMRIQKKFQDFIRADSSASLVTEGLLGNRYVDVGRGFTGQVLENGQEIRGQEEETLKAVVDRSANLMTKLNKISDQVSDVLGDVQNGRGSLGKLITDNGVYDHLSSSLDKFDRIVNSVQAGQGTLGKLVTNDEMYDRANSAVQRVDNILEAVQTKQGTLGKLVYDSDFHDSAKQLLDNGNAVLGDVRAGKGTLGKLATDDTLFQQYRQVGENLSQATAKLNENSNTAGKFFSDPKLYDNVSGVAGDMRQLINDFRTNPKKFLHVKFSIF